MQWSKLRCTLFFNVSLTKGTPYTAFIGTMGGLIPTNSNIDFSFALLENANLSAKFSGSTIPHIYFKDYGASEYYCPQLKKQALIGQYCNHLDTLITLHQRKHNLLNNVVFY